MKGVAISAQRLAKLAAGLREQIPHAPPDVARPMIDAAAELQRMSDEIIETSKQNAAELEQRIADAMKADVCPCETCTARRAGDTRQGKQH